MCVWGSEGTQLFKTECKHLLKLENVVVLIVVRTVIIMGGPKVQEALTSYGCHAKLIAEQ